MITEQLLPPHAQKAVLGKFIVYAVLDGFRLELELSAYGALLKEIEHRLQDITNRELDWPTPDQTCGDYLSALADQLFADFYYPDEKARTTYAAMVSAIRSALTVPRTGADTDDLVSVFEAAVSFTINRYRRVGITVPADVGEKARISFCYDPSCKPAGVPLKYLACTTLSSDDLLASLVEVSIDAANFDPISTLALPYVLLHETVCHVLQGPYSDNREQADANSRFAEGWMDVAAYRLHDEILERLTPDRLTLPARAASQSEAAQKVHFARRAPSDSDRAWPHRAIGAETAEKVASIFHRLPEFPDQARDPFMLLSLGLNSGPYTAAELDLFVTQLSAKLRTATDEAFAVKHLRRFLRTGDLHSLATEVLQWNVA